VLVHEYGGKRTEGSGGLPEVTGNYDLPVARDECQNGAETCYADDKTRGHQTALSEGPEATHSQRARRIQGSNTTRTIERSRLFHRHLLTRDVSETEAHTVKMSWVVDAPAQKRP
jgi:hypothetical protein